MYHRNRWLAGTCVGAVTAGVLVASVATPDQDDGRDLSDGRNAAAAPSPPPRPPDPPAAPDRPEPPEKPERPKPPATGAFLDSGPEGVRRINGLESWLGGSTQRVGHTYLPGDLWSNIEGRPSFLQPWAKWKRASDDRMFVLNVPMLERNEEGVPDAEVRQLLRAGAEGRFDRHFRTLAERMVRMGIPDTVVVLGWEMNGTTYTHRCGPDPEAWKTYWNRIVTTMRAVPGQEFQFDFAPNRGEDAIGWTKCYPGDDVVDIIGMDSYDQPPGNSFDDQITQPYGLQHQVDFAEARNKPISYPEWGLFRNGDNAEYMRRMLEWMDEHKPLYQTITDYCPHGVWQCEENPKSSAVFRKAMSQRPDATPTPTPSEPGATPAPSESAPPGSPSCMPLDLGDWVERWLGGRQLCMRLDWYRDGASR